MNLLTQIRSLFEPALTELAPDKAKVPSYLAAIKPASNPDHGDYQANMAMALGGALGHKKDQFPAVAQLILAKLPPNDMFDEPTVAGQGFINLRLKSDFLAKAVQGIATDPKLGVASVAKLRTFVIDLSGPNVAKPLHVGHLRSTIIGDALVRILRFLGHKVIGDNHLGDWGTQFGILLYGYKHHRNDEAFKADPVRELARLYIHVRNLAKLAEGDDEEGAADNPIMQACREETSKLHAGDPENVALWNTFMPACLEMLRPIYERLGVKIDHALGESFYNPMLAGVVEDMLAKKIAEESQGAVVIPNAAGYVFPYGEQLIEKLTKASGGGAGAYLDAKDPIAEIVNQLLDRAKLHSSASTIEARSVTLGLVRKLVETCTPDQVNQVKQRLKSHSSGHEVLLLLSGETTEPPAIIRKRDGAFTYTTTDLATIKYRMDTWNPDAMLYVVGAPQALHFKTLFAQARRWGYENVEFEHLQFGSMLGADRKMFATRKGGTIELMTLLDDAACLSLQKYEANAAERREHGHEIPELSDDEKREIAEVVGVGAVKYADLSQNRTTDYVFDLDKMTATVGNTAAYMQYAYARCRAIFRKGEVDETRFRTNPPAVIITHAAERALALQLLRFQEALEAAAADYLPHLITGYLWDLAKATSVFYDTKECHVLKAATPELKDSRLLLVDLVGRVLKQSLDLLGIRVVERM